MAFMGMMIVFFVSFIIFSLIIFVIIVIVQDAIKKKRSKSISRNINHYNSEKIISEAQIFSKMISIREGSPYYYIAFEFLSGCVLEFCVSKEKYKEFKEGDVGVLTFQGTRYISFERNV